MRTTYKVTRTLNPATYGYADMLPILYIRQPDTLHQATETSRKRPEHGQS